MLLLLFTLNLYISFTTRHWNHKGYWYWSQDNIKLSERVKCLGSHSLALTECDTCHLRVKNYSIFFLQWLEHTPTRAHNHKHANCTVHMLTVVSKHVQYLDTQLCQDKSIMLRYYAVCSAGENCLPHPSSVFYFLLKISTQINKSQL